MESDVPIPEECPEQNWSKIILVLYAKTFKGKKKTDLWPSLFTKTLERKNLGTGGHSYSVILEPKTVFTPPSISLPTYNKTQLRGTVNSKTPTRGDFLLTFPWGLGFLPLDSQSVSLLFSYSTLLPVCGKWFHQTCADYLQYNGRNLSQSQNTCRYKLGNYSNTELFNPWFMST